MSTVEKLGNVKLIHCVTFFYLKTCQLDVNFFAMIFNVLFNDFAKPERFLAIQNKFVGYNQPDFGSESVGFNGIVASDFTILYRMQNERFEDVYETISFQTFLLSKIENLSKDTVERIQEKIVSHFRYNKEERATFVEVTFHDYLNIADELGASNHLPPLIKEKVTSQLRMVVDYLSSYDFDKEQQIVTKFQFNLNRTDLLVLIHLLRERKLLNHPFDSSMGFLIDKNFLYLDSDSGQYAEISKSSKYLNDIKNGNRTVSKSIDRLKEIFKNDTFYDGLS